MKIHFAIISPAALAALLVLSACGNNDAEQLAANAHNAADANAAAVAAEMHNQMADDQDPARMGDQMKMDDHSMGGMGMKGMTGNMQAPASNNMQGMGGNSMSTQPMPMPMEKEDHM